MIRHVRALFEIRQRQGLTQAELASRTGISQANLSKIERGEQDPTVSTVLRICSALGIPPAEIFKEETPRETLQWTRPRLERLAKAALGFEEELDEEEKKIVELLKVVLPHPRGRRLSSKKVYASWYELKQRLSEKEIKTLVERVGNAQTRLEAEKERAYQKLVKRLKTLLHKR